MTEAEDAWAEWLDDITCTTKDKWTPLNWNREYRNPSELGWTVAVGAIVMCLMGFGIGANDSANSWASSVKTGAIGLRKAMIIGGTMEFVGAVTLGYGVSSTIQKGVAKINDPEGWACGYCDTSMSLFMVGMLSALFGAGIFLLLATFTSMPVSTTHSIIGAVVGATAVGIGFAQLNWDFDGGLTAIIASWFISPVMSGLIGQITFIITDFLIIRNKRNSTRRAILSLPLLYGLTSGVLVFLILVKSKPTKELHEEGKLEYWLMALISCAVCAGVGIACQLIIVPLVRRRIEDHEKSSRDGDEVAGGSIEHSDCAQGQIENSVTTQERISDSIIGNDTDTGDVVKKRNEGDDEKTDVNSVDGKAIVCKVRPDESRRPSEDSVEGEATLHVVANEFERVPDAVKSKDIETGGFSDKEAKTFDPTLFAFQYLIIFVAFWESFAHGANDTANATAAFGAIVNAYNGGFETNPKADSCKKPDTPIWVMAIAGAFVFIGMNAMGGRVIRTVGQKITKINYHTGFCIEFASMLTVIIASVLELPVSSTHCQVGAVVFVGMLRNGHKNVQWPLFGKIALSWLLTLPVAGCIAALGTVALRPTTRE